MDEQVSFRVARDEFATAVGWVAKNLPSKPAQPVLRGMLITANDDGLELAGFDYETSAKVDVAADVSEPGKYAVAGRLLAEIVNTLPNKEVEMVYNGSQVSVTCGNASFDLPVIPLDDYPELPVLPAVTGHVDPALFATAVGQVATAAGRDETLAMLTGIHMELTDNTMLLAATDRFRMAVRTLPWKADTRVDGSKLLVPARTLFDHVKSVESHLSEDIAIAVGSADDIDGQSLFGMVADRQSMTTRLLDADFPNFRPLLPKQHTAIATIDVAALQGALKRVKALVVANAQVRLEFSEGQVIVSAGGSDIGHGQDIVPCAFTGEPLLTAFNPNYLSDGLSAVGSERVMFGFTQPSRPAILIPEPEELPEADDEGVFTTPETEFTYLLMPVRLPG